MAKASQIVPGNLSKEQIIHSSTKSGLSTLLTACITNFGKYEEERASRNKINKYKSHNVSEQLREERRPNVTFGFEKG